MNYSNNVSDELYNIIIYTINFCKKYNNPNLFIRVYKYTLKIYNINLLNILEYNNTNIFKLSIRCKYYDILLHLNRVLDMNIYIDKCSKNDLDIINKNIDIFNLYINSVKNIKYNKLDEQLILYRLFMIVLQKSSYNLMIYMYEMYHYYNNEYPQIQINTNDFYVLINQVYQVDSIKFLINMNYLSIKDLVIPYYVHTYNNINYNLTIIDFIYQNKINIHNNNNNNNNKTKIMNLIYYIIDNLYKINYNVNEEYTGFYKKNFIELMQRRTKIEFNNIKAINIISDIERNNVKLSEYEITEIAGDLESINYI